jgi:ankyrin repeat protein
MGADFHARNEDGMTSLHLAAENGKYSTVFLLIRMGADIHAKNKDGMTPLQLAKHQW